MRRLVSAVALAALTLVACGGSGGGDASDAPAAGASVDTDRILDFSLPTVSGGEVQGADYGGKSLALWFWAPW